MSILACEDQQVRTGAVIKAVVDKLLGGKLVVNHLRGCIAEAIVAQALCPPWNWCSEDWGGWDFDRADGVKLEVKQSAARQTWQRPDDKPSRASFDIAMRRGQYDEHSQGIEGVGRWASIYVFAHHPIADETADHRDPEQWIFYVVAAEALPSSATIGLKGVQRLGVSASFHQLLPTVERVATTVGSRS